MRYKLVDANGVVHAYSRNKAKIIRYLNENYRLNGYMGLSIGAILCL